MEEIFENCSRKEIPSYESEFFLLREVIQQSLSEIYWMNSGQALEESEEPRRKNLRSHTLREMRKTREYFDRQLAPQ